MHTHTHASTHTGLGSRRYVSVMFMGLGVTVRMQEHPMTTKEDNRMTRIQEEWQHSIHPTHFGQCGPHKT